MREQIKEILKEVLEMEHIKDDISQNTCDNWDSLSQMALIIELEKMFDVSFGPEDIAEMKSLDLIEKTIVRKIS